MQVTIRPAREADYARIEAIWQQVHALHVALRPDAYAPRTPILPPERFQEHLASGTIHVAEQSGYVSGILVFCEKHVLSVSKGMRRILFIDVMAVDESCRRQGIGQQMLSHIRQYASDNGFDGVELQVAARNTAARAMYESFGFHEKSVNMELL